MTSPFDWGVNCGCYTTAATQTVVVNANWYGTASVTYQTGTAVHYNEWYQQQVFVTPLAQAQMNSYQVYGQTYVAPTPTAAEIARWEKEYKERESAAARANELLESLLTEAQKQQYAKERAFELQVNDKLYRIAPGNRVARLDPTTRKVESWFCIHPEHTHILPSEDVAVAQKLLLETNEAEFLRIANETKVGGECTPDEAVRIAQLEQAIAALDALPEPDHLALQEQAFFDNIQLAA